MAMAFSVAGQHVVMVGGGRSGVAAAELLVHRGARVTLADAAPSIDSAERLRALGVTLELGPHREDQFVSADLVVLSPGVPPSHEAVQRARQAGVPVIGEVELASRWLSGRVIAITGTKGKSTTTTLTTRMLQEGGLDATAGGNLGNALSAQVTASRATTLHIVEVSSFQLETTDTFHPWIAVLLNLSPDHLDRHASLDDYRAAKRRIFANQTASDWAVVNSDDGEAKGLADGTPAARFDFGFHPSFPAGVTVDGEMIVRREARATAPLFPISSVKLPGRHLLADVLAATAVSSLAGVPAGAMQRAVERFPGLEHALERVAVVDGVQFINDSKATNIASAQRAIESFERRVVVILGGRFKGGRFADLRPLLPGRVSAIVAIGEAKSLIHRALGDVVDVIDADSMSSAVRIAFDAARPNGTVLLAPACSSFDMFRDYADRGRTFKEEVGKLEKSER
jgi:UDP-N-acetylmuramoylalanine--D-glutamate ligase